MIVDDSPFQRRKFVENLEKKGFLVVECSTGQECLDTLEEKIPNLILMDMTMPEMDGATTCRKIRERKELAALPIVFLSANEDVGSKLIAFDSGASDYVLKTAPESELLVRLRNQIQFSNMVELLKSTLDQSKSLLHAVHHDLANYLSSVTGCYELMKFSLEGKDFEEGLQTNLDRMGHCIRSTNRFLGTGFGVKMANRLMIAHGGSLTIHSQPKDSGFAWHGTRVILHIPKGDYCSGEKVFSGTNNLVV